MQAAKTAAKEPSREMAHILVVDDEKSICELLEITFRKEGHRVEVAHNVEEGQAQTRKRALRHHHLRRSHARGNRRRTASLYARNCSDSYFVLITGVPTLETAIAAANEGANR